MIRQRKKPTAKKLTLGELLKKHRKALGYTRKEVKEKTGVCDVTLFHIEKGRTLDPKFGVMVKLANLYKIELNIFMDE